MVIDTLKALFLRDLNKLKTEINLYADEKNIWLLSNGISNSAGNLCLHLIGNLNAYIGVGLANTAYIRDRDREFSDKNIPKATILKQIEDTMQIVENGLNELTESRMKDDFPILIWYKPMQIEYTLFHLLTHLNYHLGQLNYHRRLFDKK